MNNSIFRNQGSKHWGRGGDSVGREVAYDSRGPWLKTNSREGFLNGSVNCLLETNKIKKKRMYLKRTCCYFVIAAKQNTRQVLQFFQLVFNAQNSSQCQSSLAMVVYNIDPRPTKFDSKIFFRLGCVFSKKILKSEKGVLI